MNHLIQTLDLESGKSSKPVVSSKLVVWSHANGKAVVSSSSTAAVPRTAAGFFQKLAYDLRESLNQSSNLRPPSSQSSFNFQKHQKAKTVNGDIIATSESSAHILCFEKVLIPIKVPTCPHSDRFKAHLSGDRLKLWEVFAKNGSIFPRCYFNTRDSVLNIGIGQQCRLRTISKKGNDDGTVDTTVATGATSSVTPYIVPLGSLSGLDSSFSFYGGRRFDTENFSPHTEWNAFGEELWFLPSLEYEFDTDGNAGMLAANLVYTVGNSEERKKLIAKTTAILDSLLETSQNVLGEAGNEAMKKAILPSPSPAVVSSSVWLKAGQSSGSTANPKADQELQPPEHNYQYVIPRERYEANVQKAVDTIRKGESPYSKVVCASAIELPLKSQFSNRAGCCDYFRFVMEKTREVRNRRYVFYLEPSATSGAFFSLSPERLCKITTNCVARPYVCLETEALAGTFSNAELEKGDANKTEAIEQPQARTTPTNLNRTRSSQTQKTPMLQTGSSDEGPFSSPSEGPNLKHAKGLAKTKSIDGNAVVSASKPLQNPKDRQDYQKNEEEHGIVVDYIKDHIEAYGGENLTFLEEKTDPLRLKYMTHLKKSFKYRLDIPDISSTEGSERVLSPFYQRGDSELGSLAHGIKRVDSSITTESDTVNTVEIRQISSFGRKKFKDREVPAEGAAGTAPNSTSSDESGHSPSSINSSFNVIGFDVLEKTEAKTQSSGSEKQDHTYEKNLLLRKKVVHSIDFFVNEVQPTPAVAGLPKNVSVDEISRLEAGFDRGFYAGPSGKLNSGSADLIVALRSALGRPSSNGISVMSSLITGSSNSTSSTSTLLPPGSKTPAQSSVQTSTSSQYSVRAFGGAGIVGDSNPESEWKEINLKMLQFFKNLDYFEKADQSQSSQSSVSTSQSTLSNSVCSPSKPVWIAQFPTAGASTATGVGIRKRDRNSQDPNTSRCESASEVKNAGQIVAKPPDIVAKPDKNWYFGMANLNTVWANLIVEELWRNKVDHFVICPGSRSTPLVVALQMLQKRIAAHGYTDMPLTYSIHNDERGAGFLALGRAKAQLSQNADPSSGTKKSTAIIVTSGTAVANLLPACIEASLSQVPLVFLLCDRPMELQGCGANQTIGQGRQLNMFKDFNTFSRELSTPTEAVPVHAVLSDVSFAVASGWGRGSSSTRGPVILNLQFRENLAPDSGAVRGFPAGHYLGAEWDTRYLAENRFFKKWISSRNPYAIYPSMGFSSSNIDSVVCRIRDAVKPVIPSEEKTSADEVSEDSKRGSEPSKFILLVVGMCETEAQIVEIAKISTHLRPHALVFADVTSGLRLSWRSVPGLIRSADQLLHSDYLKEKMQPSVILQFGGPITSKRIDDYLLHCRTEFDSYHVRISDRCTRLDPSHVVSEHLFLSDYKALRTKVETQIPISIGSKDDQLKQNLKMEFLFYQQAVVQRLDEELLFQQTNVTPSGNTHVFQSPSGDFEAPAYTVDAVISSEFATSPLSEPQVSRVLTHRILGNLDDYPRMRQQLFLSSSMPIRDMEFFCAGPEWRGPASKIRSLNVLDKDSWEAGGSLSSTSSETRGSTSAPPPNCKTVAPRISSVSQRMSLSAFTKSPSEQLGSPRDEMGSPRKEVGSATSHMETQWAEPNEFNQSFVRVAANRGASGIEGIINSAAGFALGNSAPKTTRTSNNGPNKTLPKTKSESSLTTCIIGDIAAMIDITAIHHLGTEFANSNAGLIIVIVNNCGCGIFSFLPIRKHGELFSPFFDSPTELNFEQLVAGLGGGPNGDGVAFHRVQTGYEFDTVYKSCVEEVERSQMSETEFTTAETSHLSSAENTHEKPPSKSLLQKRRQVHVIEAVIGTSHMDNVNIHSGLYQKVKDSLSQAQNEMSSSSSQEPLKHGSHSSRDPSQSPKDVPQASKDTSQSTTSRSVTESVAESIKASKQSRPRTGSAAKSQESKEESQQVEPKQSDVKSEAQSKQSEAPSEVPTVTKSRESERSKVQSKESRRSKTQYRESKRSKDSKRSEESKGPEGENTPAQRTIAIALHGWMGCPEDFDEVEEACQEQGIVEVIALPLNSLIQTYRRRAEEIMRKRKEGNNEPIPSLVDDLVDGGPVEARSRRSSGQNLDVELDKDELDLADFLRSKKRGTAMEFPTILSGLRNHDLYGRFLKELADKIRQIKADKVGNMNCEIKVILVGYSLGGRVAACFSERYSELIDGLCLISAHTGISEEPSPLQTCIYETCVRRTNRFEQDLGVAYKLFDAVQEMNRTSNSSESEWHAFIEKWYEGNPIWGFKGRAVWVPEEGKPSDIDLADRPERQMVMEKMLKKKRALFKLGCTMENDQRVNEYIFQLLFFSLAWQPDTATTLIQRRLWCGNNFENSTTASTIGNHSTNRRLITRLISGSLDEKFSNVYEGILDRLEIDGNSRENCQRGNDYIRHIRIPNSGHSVVEEEPEQVAEVLECIARTIAGTLRDTPSETAGPDSVPAMQAQTLFAAAKAGHSLHFESVAFFPFELPLTSSMPLFNGNGEKVVISSRKGAICRVRMKYSGDREVMGFGEVSPLLGFSSDGEVDYSNEIFTKEVFCSEEVFCPMDPTQTATNQTANLENMVDHIYGVCTRAWTRSSSTVNDQNEKTKPDYDYNPSSRANLKSDFGDQKDVVSVGTYPAASSTSTKSATSSTNSAWRTSSLRVGIEQAVIQCIVRTLNIGAAGSEKTVRNNTTTGNVIPISSIGNFLVLVMGLNDSMFQDAWVPLTQDVITRNSQACTAPSAESSKTPGKSPQDTSASRNGSDKSNAKTFKKTFPKDVRSIKFPYKVTKVKVGSPDLQSDAKRVNKIAKGLDAVRLDANRAWTLEQGLEFLKYLSEETKEKIEYFEEPIKVDDTSKSDCRSLTDRISALSINWARFHELTGIEIACDESYNDVLSAGKTNDRNEDVLNLLLANCQYFIMRPTLYGMVHCGKLVPNLRRLNVQPVLSSMFDGPIGLSYLTIFAGVLNGVQKLVPVVPATVPVEKQSFEGVAALESDQQLCEGVVIQESDRCSGDNDIAHGISTHQKFVTDTEYEEMRLRDNGSEKSFRISDLKSPEVSCLAYYRHLVCQSVPECHVETPNTDEGFLVTKTKSNNTAATHASVCYAEQLLNILEQLPYGL